MVKSILFVLLFPILLFSQAPQPHTRYYPLAVGNRWEYQGINEDDRETREVLSYNADLEQYLILVIQRFLAAPPMSSKELWEQRGKKTLFLGSNNRLFGQSEIEVFSSSYERVHEKLKVGESWLTGTSTNCEQRKVISVLTVRVPAGTFDDVCKIEVQVGVRDPNRARLKKTIFRFYEYYAPGVGLVKKELVSDGTITTMLTLKSYAVK